MAAFMLWIYEGHSSFVFLAQTTITATFQEKISKLTFLFFLFPERKRKKSKRKHQYSLLTDDLEGHDAMELLPKANGELLVKLQWLQVSY